MKKRTGWVFRLLFIALLILTYSFWYPPLMTGIDFTRDGLIDLFDGDQDQSQNFQEAKLIEPENQTFSINNFELGKTRNDVENVYGAPKRESLNEYGQTWSSYHDDYQNFLMVLYDEKDIIHGMYTNQALISSKKQLRLGSTKSEARQHFGEPLSAIRKGLVNYLIQDNGEYDVFLIDESYVTFFYDLHEEDTVTAIQIISEELELAHTALYAQGSSELAEGFALQLFDITNATRQKFGLSILDWSAEAAETANHHSLDMAQNNYFDHTNLDGLSPFDRMIADQISFKLAGENLAHGQTSSIFAHQGLLNSLGHRENILQPDFSNLGIGVAFNEENQPYFTELFYLN